MRYFFIAHQRFRKCICIEFAFKYRGNLTLPSHIFSYYIFLDTYPKLVVLDEKRYIILTISAHIRKHNGRISSWTFLYESNIQPTSINHDRVQMRHA